MFTWFKELAAELFTIDVPSVEQAEYEAALEKAYNHFLRRGYDHESAGEAAHEAVNKLTRKEQPKNVKTIHR